MTSLINLTTLRQARAGALYAKGEILWGRSMTGGGHPIQSSQASALGWITDREDARCIVLEHNAADVLIDIAETGLVLVESFARPHDEVVTAWERHLKALAKVSL